MLTANVVIYENGATVGSCKMEFSLESRLLNTIQLMRPTFTKVEFYTNVDVENAIGRTSYILSDGTDGNLATVVFWFPVKD